MPLPPGTRLGAYEILGPLGAGGMGEVYRARDLRLGREVALKVLPSAVSGDAARLARFEREARTVAALNHPNIVTLFSVEDEGGTRFITMERVEGQSLDHVVVAGGLPVPRVIEIGIGLADALAAAHEKGVVHRDLKPANVMLTRDERVKVLDFGLAKLAEPDSDPALTQAATIAAPLSAAGQVMGTVPYMAPEQIRGEAVDGRTDLFALGIVLYELAAGTRPFTGASNADISSAILRDPPTPLRSVRGRLPVELERIVNRCLEKAPRDRIQTALEVSNELRLLRKGLELEGAGLSPPSRAAAGSQAETAGVDAGSTRARPRVWIGLGVALILAVAAVGYFASRRGAPAARDRSESAATAPAPEHSIAVLPFLNLSPDRNEDYFSDGISEELLNLLARIPSLQVTARTSSFSFKGKEVAIPEIARQLHVRHVLEGSVRRAGDRVRITAELIDASTDTHLWSQSYDRTLRDVFMIQDEIAGDVVQQLKVQLLGAAPKQRETRPEAYPLYLQAAQLSRKRSAEAYARADSLLARVLEIDPQYAPAWTFLANNRLNESIIGLRPTDKGFASAHEAATRAVAIDPEFARAHASLGMISMFSGDIPAAAQHFERALALDSSDPIVLGNSSAVLKSLGRIDEALALDQRTVNRDPVNTVWLFNLGSAQNWAGRPDLAAASMRTVLGLSPGYAGAHLVLGEALIHQGKPAQALAEIQQESYPGFRAIGLPMAFHALGRSADADTALASLIAHFGKEAPYDVAYNYAVRGDPDHAFEWLDRAAAAHDPSLSLILVENLFDPLHSDARWLPFLKRIGKGPEAMGNIRFNVAIASGS